MEGVSEEPIIFESSKQHKPCGRIKLLQYLSTILGNLLEVFFKTLTTA